MDTGAVSYSFHVLVLERALETHQQKGWVIYGFVRCSPFN